MPNFDRTDQEPLRAGGYPYVDVLLSEGDFDCEIDEHGATCHVVYADACSGLVGVVCDVESSDGTKLRTTIDEFFVEVH
jgi:hypothetical protein